MVPGVRGLVCVVGMLLLPIADLHAQVRVGPGVPPPAKVHHVEPIYPTSVLIGCAITQTSCPQVMTTVDVTIGIDGSVVNAVVLSSNPPFHQAALTAVRQWRYQPVAAPVIMTETVTFTPPGSGTPGPAPPAPQPPQPPQNLQATYVGGILTLTWSPPPIGGAPTSYVIRAGYLPSLSNLADFDTGSLAATFSTFVPPGFPPPDTTGSSVNPGGQLFIKVHARNAAGTSVQSNVVLVDTRTGGGGGGGGAGCTSPPGAPGGLTMMLQGTNVSFSWIASAAASGYLLEAGSQSGAANLAAVNLGAQTTFDASAPPGTYFVRVRATNGCGQSPPSNEVVVVISGGAVPPGGSGGAPAGGQWRPCSEAVASIVSAAPVSIEFVNVSSQPRLLYWIDFGGVQRSYGVLQTGAERGPHEFRHAQLGGHRRSRCVSGVAGSLRRWSVRDPMTAGDAANHAKA